MSLLVILVFAGMMFIPVVSAVNDSNPTPPGWVGQFDEWAGKKDMSEYNPVVTPVPIEKMDKETAEKYPGVEVIDSDIQFPTNNNYVDAQKSSMKAVKINFVKPSLKTNSEAKALVPTVAPEYGYFNWYWTQDTIVSQNVIIHNFGSTNASGTVYFVSIEDGLSSTATFTDLSPGMNCSVNIPFQVIGNYSSVGIKPMGLFITVDPSNTVTWSGQLALDAIEKYNNDASHLPDPDSGDNLETSDLYHFPYNDGYAIILEAAAAGDNTSSPYDTAQKLNDYVFNKMEYVSNELYSLYAASDLYIINHEYEGVCDEHATMDVTFSRSLGIPSRFLGITWLNETGSCIGHAILENWDGNSWIHSDPTWNSFNNPQIYNHGNNTHMYLTKYTDADDSRFTEDPAGDGLLRYEDLVAIPLGELPEYN
ncbi:transglutaminase domain protein [Methanolacinia petrolearia DSM 11571]|uniref:Transglutaminase domain protein n=1 Tax=Methanolacinia petrolearia (strain DSM 11571 / OCM 486 / SEBR 4847) TaxID=679926 RepID=E1RI70_METP4|nr:transglutaminase domain protein [Methanolacinia petrolearia DSM 11571]